MLKHALSYAALGWKVFPLATSGDIKAPHSLTTKGREAKQGGHHAATNDRATLERWWKQSPESGIGLNCEASGLVLVDVDPRKAGDKTLKQLREQYPDVFESSVEGQTGGDGLHLFFLAEEGKRYPGTLGAGIDVKKNGYVVLPPSPHPSGKRYRWSPGKSPDEGDAFMPRLPAELCYEIKNTRHKGGASSSRLRADDAIADVDPDDPFADITDDRALGLTEEQIRKIVFDIPNSGHCIGIDHEDYPKEGARFYDDWFEVLCGIYHETSGSEEGRQIALEWSEQAAVHTQEKFDKSWDSAKHDDTMRPKTMRSVIRMSNLATKDEREAKYETIRSRFVEATSLEEVAEAVEAARGLPLTNKLQRDHLGSEYRAAVKRITHSAVITMAQAKKDIAYIDPTITNVPDWCRSVCFVTSENVFLDYRDARRAWTKQAFDNTFMRAAMSEEDIRSGASRPTHLPSDLALTRYGVKTVDARGYLPWDKNWAKDPFFEMDGRTLVNTYTGRFAARVPKEIDGEGLMAIETFKLFMRTLFPEERDQRIIVSCLRYVLGPRKRIGWATLFYSVEGIGKTLLFELIAAMVGRNNVSIVNGANLHEKFNAWAEGKLVAFVEEVSGFDRKDRFDALNALKPIITNDHISIRRMNRDVYETMNTVNLFLTTNNADAFDLTRGGGDSRIWMPSVGFSSLAEVEAFKKANPHFYPNVVDAFSYHAGAIKKWILEQPYHPDFVPGGRAPASERKQQVIEESKSDVQLLIEDALRQSARPDVSGELLRIDALIEVCGDIDPSIPLPVDRWLASLLRGMGFTRLGRARVGDRKAPPGMFWSRTPDTFRKGPLNLTAAVNRHIEEHTDDAL